MQILGSAINYSKIEWYEISAKINANLFDKYLDLVRSTTIVDLFQSHPQHMSQVKASNFF